jgi:hypothetical protein
MTTHPAIARARETIERLQGIEHRSILGEATPSVAPAETAEGLTCWRMRAAERSQWKNERDEMLAAIAAFEDSVHSLRAELERQRQDAQAQLQRAVEAVVDAIGAESGTIASEERERMDKEFAELRREIAELRG